MIDFSWQSQVQLRDGTPVVLQYPVMEDAEKLMGFINPIVREDTFILMDEEQSINQEKNYLASIISMMHQETAVKIFAHCGDRIVGGVDIHRYLYKQDHVGRLGISISQDFRGKGLGKILMIEALSQAKELMGLKLIELTCHEDNVAGIKLYNSLGFVEYGVLPEAVLHRGKYCGQLNFYKKL